MSNALALSIFTLFVLGALALDLGVFQRRRRALTLRQAILASIVWIALALAFNLGIYFWRGPQPALEFLTGYILEIALSIDNVFIFAITFAYSAVPPENQHRVLFWGVLGALVMRAIFIVAGVELVTHFRWVFYIFGAFLLISGLSLFREKKEGVSPDRNPVIKLARKLFSVSENYEGALFFVRRNGRLLATPLLFVLLMIETTDVLMAVDSIPAVLGVTTDSFIVFTSNVFAVLGLRALYFVLARALMKFRYLRLGLALILVFIGTTMIGSDFYRLPTRSSLAVICAIISFTLVISVVSGHTASREVPATPSSK